MLAREQIIIYFFIHLFIRLYNPTTLECVHVLFYSSRYSFVILPRYRRLERHDDD
jgi:hypothetical protein